METREPKYFQEKNSYQEGKVRHLVDALIQVKVEEEKDADLALQSRLTDIDLQATINVLFGGGSDQGATTFALIAFVLFAYLKSQEHV